MASFSIASGTSTQVQTLNGGQTGSILPGATISTPGDQAIHIGTGTFNGTLAFPTLLNVGTITAGSDAIVQDSSSFAGTFYIRNIGTIIGGGAAYYSFGNTGNIVFDNAGTLTSSDAITVFLGGSDDIFVVRNGSSTNGSVDGFLGIDTLYYGLWSGTGVSVTLGGAATGMQGNNNFDNVYGSAQGDSITGNGGVNVLNGLDGDDMLSGLSGNDTLFGAGGNDTMLGGDGADLFYGGAGNDSMAGGTGNDTYQVTDAGDVVTELGIEGTDSVFVTASWTVSSGNIEGVYAVGVGLTLTGSSLADVLVADASGSTLVGGGGDDTLFGQAGADMLMGGAGNDTIRGGGGADTLVGGTGDDQLVGGGAADNFVFDAPGWGYDQVFDFVSGADKLDMRGSGATSMAALTFYSVGTDTAVIFDGARIDVYGVGSLSASDFIFA